MEQSRDLVLVLKADSQGLVSKAQLESFKTQFLELKEKVLKKGASWEDAFELESRVIPKGYKDLIRYNDHHGTKVTFDEWFLDATNLSESLAPATQQIFDSMSYPLNVSYQSSNLVVLARAWSVYGAGMIDRALKGSTSLNGEQKKEVAKLVGNKMAVEALIAEFTPEQLNLLASTTYATKNSVAVANANDLAKHFQKNLGLLAPGTQEVSRAVPENGIQQPARLYNATSEIMVSLKREHDDKSDQRSSRGSPNKKFAVTGATGQPVSVAVNTQRAQQGQERSCHWCKAVGKHEARNCPSNAAVAFNREHADFGSLSREMQRSVLKEFKRKYYVEHPGEAPTKG